MNPLLGRWGQTVELRRRPIVKENTKWGCVDMYRIVITTDCGTKAKQAYILHTFNATSRAVRISKAI
jgi:hypothetical protein